MGKTSEKTNITISIRDLFLYVVSRWRVLIIWLVIGAVLGGAYSAVKSLRSGKADIANQRERAIEIYDEMTETDKTNVQNSINTLIHYINQVEFYSEYMEKSLFQKLNPVTAKVGVLTYSVDTTDDKMSKDSIEKAFAANIADEVFLQAVSDEFGVSEKEAFYYYDGIVQVGDSETSNNTQQVNNINSPILIRIYGENEDFVNRMMPLVEASVDRMASSLSSGKDTFNLDIIKKTIRNNDDLYIYNRQEVFVTNKKLVLKNCNDLINNLDSDQLTAVKYFITEQYDGDYIEVVFPGESLEEQENGGIHISKKWVLAGAAGLLILAIIAIIIKYLIKGVVRCYDDIEYTYGIQVLGTYDDPETASKEHKFILDRWLKSLRIKRKSQDRESSVALIAKKLQLLAKNHDVNNICVAIGPDVVTDESFMSDVAEKAEGINVTVASNILRNADAISKILEADGVVLLEQMDRSRFSAIDEERVMCSGNNIRILGAIVAE